MVSLEIVCDVAPIVTCAVTFIGVMIALWHYRRSLSWNYYLYLAELYYEILKIGMELGDPDFHNPEKTKNYKEWEKSDAGKFFSYTAYARMCWTYAGDIYDAKSRFNMPDLIELYASTFERFKELHGVWFQDDTNSRDETKFIKFIKNNEWRKDCMTNTGGRTIDRLRWDAIGHDYDEKILTPFSAGVKNPLFGYIDKLDRDNVVADFGCGTGRLVEILSKKEFKKVCGIDYSENMLRMAKKRYASPNVEYKNMDIINLSKLYEKINIAFSINSILPKDPDDTPKMIQEIYRTLKPGGLFIAILPSFDTILYLKKLWFEDYFNKLECRRKAKRRSNFPYSIVHWLKKGNNKRKAELATYLEFRKRKLNKAKHLYADDFVNVQRFIHENEIRPLLEKTGFKILCKDKVTYPWELCEKYNYGYFPEKDEIWDWFVVAKK